MIGLDSGKGVCENIYTYMSFTDKQHKHCINHLRARPLKVVPDCLWLSSCRCGSELVIDRLGSGLVSGRLDSGLVRERLGSRACHLLVRLRVFNPSLYCRLYIKVWPFYLWGWRQCSCLFDLIFLITVTLKANVWSCSGVRGGVGAEIKSITIDLNWILINFTDQSQS